MALLTGPGQQLTFCRGVVAVTGEAIQQACGGDAVYRDYGLDDVAAAWVQQRQKRDGQDNHMTFLSKVDIQLLAGQVHDGTQAWSENDIQTPSATDMADIARAAALLLAKISSTWDWVDVGTGTCKDASGESAFRVVLWPAAAAMREKLALPPKDFHITLGFQGCDVHSKSKGVGTLSAAPDATSLARLLQLASPLATGPEIGPFSESIELLLETALMGARHHSDTAAHVEALQTLCLYHGRLKQPSKVLVLADELLQLRSDPRGRCSRAFALVMLSRLSEALEALEAAKAQVEELPGEEREVEETRIAQAIAHCKKKLGLPSAPGYSEASTMVVKDNYPKTPHLPFSPGVNEDDTCISDCAHLLAGEVVVTEKLDGGNCCLKDGQVFGRTHAQPATHESFSAVKELAANFGGQLHDLQLFGENMQGVHSIEYGNLQSFFYVFAARRGTTWLSWDDTVALAEQLDLPTVPLVFRGHFSSSAQLQKCLEKWKNEASAVGADVSPEGFVVRRSSSISGGAFQDEIAKFVRANHIQTDEAWKRRWKKALIGPLLDPRPWRTLEVD
ncbi:unnamed protein product [Durusdinium trenchii]|uniref:RNA ligase domain-containing protein n=1 Tax=Durusdinium trenchii TaxID=1381693 RepID=A0ABP0IKC6_9DINO